MPVNFEKLFVPVTDSMSDGMYIVDRHRSIRFWNKSAEMITGYKAEEVVGRFCHDNLLMHITRDGVNRCQAGCPLQATVCDGKHRQLEVLLRHKDGGRIPVLVNTFPVRDGDETIGAMEFFSPMSPKVYDDKLFSSLSEAAMYDGLTSLPNRQYLSVSISSRLLDLVRFRRGFCVAFGDIDHFSQVNNTYGHSAGDQVLIATADNVRAILRSDDLWGRWGGEEFVGIFPAKNCAEAALIGEKIRQAVENVHVEHEGRRIPVSISVGVTMAKPEDDPERVVARADLLMYESKNAGRNRVTVKR